MKTVPAYSEDRLFFFDNLRYFLVLLVVLFHSLASYSNFSEWWTVNDDNFEVFNSLILFLDVFMMPALFLIAGFFALHSHQGLTAWAFIRKKLTYLGIPLFIGVILINPIQMYISEYSRGSLDIDFWHCGLFKIKSAFSFYTGLINPSDLSNQFSHFHFWFICLLLLFFVAFAVIRKIHNTLFSKKTVLLKTGSSSNFSIIVVFFSTGLLVFVLNIFIYAVFPVIAIPNTWFSIGNIIQFQPSRTVLYISCFCLGIYAYHKKWFLYNTVPGHIVVWTVLSAVLFVFFHETAFSALKEYSQNKAILYTFLHPMFFFSIVLTLVCVGVQYWNSASKINRLLADNSYNIYLIHMVFVYVFQLAMLNLPMIPVYIKPFIVCGLSIGVSLLVSHFAIKKSPRLSVAGMVGIFVLYMASK